MVGKSSRRRSHRRGGRGGQRDRGADPVVVERDFASLPLHILDLVARKLVSSKHYLGFSLVCKSWFRVAKDNVAQHIATRQHNLEAPLLLIHSSQREIWKLFDVIRNKFLYRELKLPKKSFYGSAKGWLLAVDEIDGLYVPILMLPQFTPANEDNSIIMLPPIPIPVERYAEVSWATLSADPMSNKERCIIAISLLPVSNYSAVLALCWLKEGSWSWTLIEHSLPITNVLLFDKKLYVIDFSKRIFYADVDVSPPLLSLFAPEFCDHIVKELDINQTMTLKLLDLDGERFILVERIYATDSEGFPISTTGFRVFEFDLVGNWTEKYNLEHLALFVGDMTTVVAVGAEGVANNSHTNVVVSGAERIAKNHIYFTPELVRTSNEYGGYDMFFKRISFVRFKNAASLIRGESKDSDLMPIWVVPSIRLEI